MKEGLWLIDYEWVFNFPIPVNLVIQRLVTQTFMKVGGYFKLMASPENPIVSICDTLFIPKTAYEKFKKYLQEVNLVNHSEQHLQYYVTGIKKPDDKPATYTLKHIEAPLFPSTLQELERNKQELESINATLAEANIKLQEKITEVSKLQEDLGSIVDSRSWKLASFLRNIYAAIRNPLKKD